MKKYNLLLLNYLFLIQIHCNVSNSKENDTIKINSPETSSIYKSKIDSIGLIAEQYCKKNKFNSNFFFLADLGIHSGKNRFFVYDYSQKKIINASLVAHGSCNKSFLANVKFSNEVGCGCSSYGKYKVGYKYEGRFGTAYKLYGLDSSNSNTFNRAIVLHSYSQVPKQEIFPNSIINSFGCPMVNKDFFDFLSKKIDSSERPLLLWVYK